MVLRQDYALEESASGRDLDTKVPLHYCLRRGMKINMSMIFRATENMIGACPRCHRIADTPENTTVKWYVINITW